MTKEKSFSGLQRCGHCANAAPMEIVGYCPQLQDHGGRDDPPFTEGYIYEVLLCPACKGVVFRRYYWCDAYDESDTVDFEVLYPIIDKSPEGLPPTIAKAHEAAQRVRSIDPNAYGVLAGRVLELVCLDRKADGNFLGNKLASLAAKGEIPDKLVDVANGLKDLRNVGAHAALGELTEAELPILDQLTRAILEYVYSAPFLAQKAEETLRKLREKKRRD
ncbi:MAG: DUF4145 domain-containing protein [candidate division Zixibacteria bacterium]|nr:DUF4145 domain-containing protein [candidate division Zixibacteria bacterium]